MENIKTQIRGGVFLQEPAYLRAYGLIEKRGIKVTDLRRNSLMILAKMKEIKRSRSLVEHTVMERVLQ